MNKNYIEFRVYLKDDTGLDVQDIADIAEDMRDALSDSLNPELGALSIFTQDVTYEVKYN